MMQGYRYGYMSIWGMHWAWFIAWILLVILLVWALIVLYRRGAARKPETTPLDILRHRYAAGEISTQEFNERRAVLQQSNLIHH